MTELAIFGAGIWHFATNKDPADAAQLAIDYGRLFAIDVSDNMWGWDDDMVVGSVHLVETLEFFHTLKKLLGSMAGLDGER